MDTKFKQIDVVPMIKHYMDEMGMYEIFDRYIPNSPGCDVKPAQVLCTMITNILVDSTPLYRVNEWLGEYMDGKTESLDLANKYNDDRLGRTSDALYRADRASLMAEMSAAAIRVHDLETKEIHNDSTTISFSGAYEAQDPQAVQLEHGHNKDHRPDYKQVVFGLNITEDGHVPISFQLFNGSRADVTTHIPNWDQLREFLGDEEFIYVADCKLCSSENMDHIAGKGGQFITILPKNRKEATEFRDSLMEGAAIDWKEGYTTENSRKKGQWIVYKTYEGGNSREGYRIIWVHSSSKEAQDRNTRERQIAKAEQALEDLSSKLNKYYLKTRQEIETAAAKACQGVSEFLNVKITEEKITKCIKEGRGRPGPNSTYREEEQRLYSLHWQRDEQAIEKVAKTDGIFPLITNVTKLPAVEVLRIYKRQPFLEKRFYTKKSVLEVAPVFLQKNERIEAMVFLYFIALMIVSLIERNMRREMERESIESLPILPSKLSTKTPTWNNIRYFFRNVHLALVVNGQQVLQSSVKGVTGLHQRLLKLLKVPLHIYTNLKDGWWDFELTQAMGGIAS